jgi:hemerythrin superfamily protein
MTTLIGRLSPSVTNMIRMDHSHVLATFQQFHAGTSVRKKQALVESACLALEIHAQLEEEIFYPALRELASDTTIVEKSYPEHSEMRRLITRLRGMVATDTEYDSTFMELMRDVMHHVADEETTLLPAAERLLSERLGDLGAEMTRRRFQLLGSRAGEIASNTVRSFPESAIVMASGAMAAGAYLFGRAGAKPDAAPR